MATNFQFYETMFTQLGTALTGYVNSTATNIIGAITPVATTLLTIYVMLWGWSMIRGVIQEPVIDGFNRMIRLTLITTAALGIGYYNGYIADFLWGTPDALATYVAGGASYTSTSSGAYLDDLMSQMWDFGDAYYQKYETTSWMGIPNSFFFLAYAIWGAAIIATGYAAFLFALSKMALAIILAVGPIFVLLIMFEPTKRFFDAWIGQALNYVFLVMLTAGAVKLIYAILETYLGAASGAMADPAMNQAIPAIVFAIVGFLVMMQMPSVSSALGGGVAVGTLGAVSWAYGKAKGGVVAMRPTNLRRGFNRARSDVRIATAGARAVGGAPLAVYRKITGGRNRVARAA